MEVRTFHIQGVAPLIMHNVRLSDPLDMLTRAVAEISSKRKKTIADLEELSRREWFGGLYLKDYGSLRDPVIPGGNIERMIRDGATKSKQGKQVQAGVIVPDDAPVIYDGPKSAEELWEDKRFRSRASCKVAQSRVIRTRPIFPDWQIKFDVHFDEELVNPSSLAGFIEVAGQQVGIGDWRPKHGRFLVVS